VFIAPGGVALGDEFANKLNEQHFFLNPRNF